MQNYQKNTYYIIHGICFKFYFRIYRLILNSISLIFIDKRQYSFYWKLYNIEAFLRLFHLFFSPEISHILYSILLNYHNKKAKIQPFWAPTTLLFITHRPTVLHWQFCSPFAIKYPLLRHDNPLFALKRLTIRPYLCFRGKKTVLLYWYIPNIKEN